MGGIKNEKEVLKVIYDTLDKKKGEDIEIIDIGHVSVIADHFVVASANNINQLQAMADAVDEEMTKRNIEVKQIEGNKNSTWILMDYGDIIVHLFSKEDRLFYNLEKIWVDGIKIDPKTLPTIWQSLT